MTYPLYPDNDLALVFRLQKVDGTTGKLEPVTTGTVTAFLSASKLTGATAAAPGLSVTATHIGGGKWLALWNATLLTKAILDPFFASAIPYAHCVAAGDVSRYVELEYLTAAPAETI